MFSHGLYNRFNLFLYNSGSSLMHGMILVLMHTTQQYPVWLEGTCMHACLCSVFIYFCKAAHVGLLGLPLSLDQSTE